MVSRLYCVLRVATVETCEEIRKAHDRLLADGP